MVNRLLITFLLFIGFWNLIYTANANEETKYFVVTAYYSPLPDQEYYLKGNYEDEVRLNWRWIKWASWQEVFDWMLAWPKKYAFWTKIYLEWIWTWVIADRWWAIVEAWERWYDADRIDVWMWYGDEWLKRALSWGKRKVSWKIVWSPETTWTWEVSVWFDFQAWNVNLSKYKKDNREYIFTKNLWIEDSWEDVKKLQEIFKNKWLYSWEIDWVYNSELIKSIIDYQLENWVIKSRSEYWAWYWWKKTRDAFFLNKDKKIELTKEDTKKETKITAKNLFETYISPESNSEDVKTLQKKLNEMELYSWAINWKYSDIKDILLKYQLSKKIVSNKTDLWAWYFGPKTRESLKNDYADFIARKEAEERDRRKLEEVKIVIQKLANEQIEKIWTPKVWEVSQNVRELQKTLKTLWYFQWKDTAIYWEITKKSILAYQIDKKLVSKETDPGAWKIWDKTKAEIKKDLAKLLLEKKLKEENVVAYNDKKAGN